MSPAPLIPNVSIPAVPVGNCCLRHLHKKFVWHRVFTPAAPYDCDGASTVRGATTIIMKPLVFAPCDEKPSPILDESVLKAIGTTIVRKKDGLALFSGTFAINDPNGKERFTGYMELMDRIGTHHDPFGPEKCDQQYHVEGWLVGKGKGIGYTNLLLRALVVVRADRLPEGLPEQPGSALYGFLNGVIVRVS